MKTVDWFHQLNCYTNCCANIKWNWMNWMLVLCVHSHIFGDSKNKSKMVEQHLSEMFIVKISVYKAFVGQRFDLIWVLCQFEWSPASLNKARTLVFRTVLISNSNVHMLCIIFSNPLKWYIRKITRNTSCKCDLVIQQWIIMKKALMFVTNIP